MPHWPRRIAEATAGLRGMRWALPPLLILLLWWPALTASYQFDDWNVIVDEPRVHSLGAWWQSLPAIRPLLKLSYALNWSIGAQPAALRIVNVLIHAVNALLLMQLWSRLGRRWGLEAHMAGGAALLATLLFALHPVQTEAVTYISGRSSALAALFCLLGLHAWLGVLDGLDTGQRTAARGWLPGSALCLIAAALCKETALVLPAVLALCAARRPWRAWLPWLAPLLVLAAALIGAALSLPRYRALLEVSLATRSLAANLMTQAHGLTWLALQLLRLDHGNADPQLPVITQLNPATLLLGALWLAIAGSALWNLHRRPIGSFAVLWFLLWLLPTNSLLPRLDVANDRQLYLALGAPAWWLALRWQALRVSHPRPAAAAALVLLTLLAGATLARNRVYATEISFWEDTAARNPGSARAANNLGMAYALACRDAEAAQQFQHALRLNPAAYQPRINLQLLAENTLPGRDPGACANAR